MDLRREQWHFPASNGEGHLLAHAWLASDPIAVVQISHGMSEHGARYNEFASFLCLHGMSVVANDHAGHGLSSQGHLGAFASTAGGFDSSVEDLHRLFIQAEERIGGLPRLLFGHSMGSVLAALYAERYEGLSALVLSGTPAAMKFSHLLKLLAGLITRAQGQLRSSPLLESLTGSAVKLSLENAVLKRAWLSRDEEKVREFCLDPLCGFDYTAGGYHTMLDAYHAINSKGWGRNIPDIPILITAGTDDSASGKGKGPARYAAQLTATGHSKVDLKLFSECRHELINELNRQEVYTFLRDWFLDKF